MVASFVVAARDHGHRRKKQRRAARAAVVAYRTTIEAAAKMRFLDVWYERIDAEQLLAKLTSSGNKASLKAARKALANARSRTSLGSLSKFAQPVDGGYRIKQEPPASYAHRSHVEALTGVLADAQRKMAEAGLTRENHAGRAASRATHAATAARTVG